MRIIVAAITLLLLITSISSCLEIEDYPNTPHISFNSFTAQEGTDILGNQVVIWKLLIDVKDGDGNIGVDGSSDTLEYAYFHNGKTHYKNIFIEYYEKINGEFVKPIMVNVNSKDTVNYYYRLPNLSTEAFNKSLKATVETKFDKPIKYINSDTIMFEVFLLDRDLNKSNVIFTPELNSKNSAPILGD